MKTDNLIKGQKPEFGNPDHIKWLAEKSAIMNGGINFDEIDWKFALYIDGGGKSKPRFEWVENFKNADCLVCYVKCPRCGRNHILLYCFDVSPQLWNDELIRIDKEVEDGFSCWSCGLEMYAEDRLLYVRPNDK